MQKSKNVWLQVNAGRINNLMTKLEEERQKSSYPGQIDFGSVKNMMTGMINEIENLQRVSDASKVAK